ncbi:MAG: hypothetical protein IJ914_05185 [Prevotella sp.]|nr:hypothetical protein [Prevotella sp.]
MDKKVYIIPRIEFDPIENDDELMAASGPAEYRVGEDSYGDYNGNEDAGGIGVVGEEDDFIIN